ncbi:unnamed protein product [Chrysodeixis includens]|uniref:Uncharacterized protein n=1 Tax=Chrysodeixis includens TaxID=689277 RepID=A0A9P0FT05_CHRIL|nr:unnamed protein product [Chrysodeixis includens]
MKTSFQNALIVIILSNYFVGSQTQHNNFFGTDSIGQHSVANPVRFQDAFSGRGNTETDEFDSEPSLVDITFDDENYFQNVPDLNRKQKDDKKSETIKIKFEADDDEEDDDENDDQEEFDNNDEDTDDSQDPDDQESEESSNKPIKFEGEQNESDDKKTKSKRVVFEKQKPHKKKTKPTRERKLRNVENPPRMPMMPPYPGAGYYGYPGYGFLGTPQSSYPASTGMYPVSTSPYAYATTYPGMAYPAQSYPGYAQYPGSTYPPVASTYMPYPTPSYPNPVDTRPANPVVYIGPAKVDRGPSIRYPAQDYPSGPSALAQNVQSKPYSSGYPGSYYQSYPTASASYPSSYPGDPSSQYPGAQSSQYPPGASSSQYSGVPNSQYPGDPSYQYAGAPSPQYPGQGQRPYSPGYQTGYPGANGPYRPPRRPKSLTQRAVSAVAEALTSIALYDDYQCVPRMLCEVAGGSTASSPTLQKATAGLQPLLGLLQSFDGVSSSPLIVFGRAAVLGVTSKNNPAACSRAYPQCPNDPEKLIYYLNNHNGGFFRFFGQPELSQPHNLEQFYGYLAGQYGLLQPQGAPNRYPNTGGYGLLPQYRELNEAKDIKAEAEERIQNKPHVNALDDVSSFDADDGPKWAFPEKDKTRDDEHVFRKEPERTVRESNSLKFPDDRPADEIRDIHKPIDYKYVRKQKNVFFPEENNYQTNDEKYQGNYEHNYNYNNYNNGYSNYDHNYQRPVSVNSNTNDYVYDYNHNIYVKRPRDVRPTDVTTLYVVRGNGDPNHPEIVRVRPGQSV